VNEFFENLKRDAAANPLIAMGIGAALLTAAGKFIDAAASTKSKNAYAKMMENAVKKNQQ
jgi:hypothetical protein